MQNLEGPLPLRTVLCVTQGFPFENFGVGGSTSTHHLGIQCVGIFPAILVGDGEKTGFYYLIGWGTPDDSILS